jgi:signal peptidase II
MLHYLWISAAVIVVDQLTKFAAVRYLTRHAEVNLLPFLNLTLTHNAGAAFGFLSDQPGWQKFFFIAVASIAVAIIFLWLRRLERDNRMVALALALILGGAIGNVIDRLVYGYVIDFIDVVFGTWHFWVFNVADSAISIGAVLLIIDALPLKKTARG